MMVTELSVLSLPDLALPVRSHIDINPKNNTCLLLLAHLPSSLSFWQLLGFSALSAEAFVLSRQMHTHTTDGSRCDFTDLIRRTFNADRRVHGKCDLFIV